MKDDISASCGETDGRCEMCQRCDSVGLQLIAAERRRQVEQEGWTPDHDAEHVDGELALVAALYATPIPLYTISLDDDRKNKKPGHRGLTLEADDPWPVGWESEWDKRDKFDRLRRLVVAGALIAAEIDRLQLVDERDGDFICPECGSFDVEEISYEDDFGSMRCNACGYQGGPGEDFPVYRAVKRPSPAPSSLARALAEEG